VEELQRLAGVLLLPLGAALALGLLALLAAAATARKLAATLGVLALAWLWTWSTPAASHWLREYLERQHPALPAAALPAADAIVLLGGGISGALQPARPYPDLGSAADRVWHAARLYHAKKAPRIVVLGGPGALPSYTGDGASAMAALLADLGVPKGALVLETRSRTTAENARVAEKLLRELGVRRALLVTSALHMPRALRSFQSVGVEIVPASTDIEVVPRPAHWIRWMPSASALAGSSRAFHELLGLARCRALGC
jgi:uncharacterized SAM-binding protein YcdF (DUF218 family)